METKIEAIQDIIGADAGNRGMAALIVPGDLLSAAQIFASSSPGTLLILSGFPCCIKESPPTETDGPPGALALARAGLALGYTRVTVVTDDCNAAVFAAASVGLTPNVTVQTFPAILSDADEKRLQELLSDCRLVIACERAGPGKDGKCYTMRGICMNNAGLIAPLHRLADERKAGVPFLAIGDGGNELGMGKVLDKIVNNPKIANGDQIGCVTVADHLIAASVSNWGGYALAAAAALVRSQQGESTAADWIQKCLPTSLDETALLERCVKAGCRDGVSGKMESTVDGMSLQTSLDILEEIRRVALRD